MLATMLRLYIVPLLVSLLAMWFWHTYYASVAWAPMVFAAIFLGQYRLYILKKNNESQ